MKLLFGLLFGVGLLTCSDEQTFYCPPAECPFEATVIDYTGLDGCGLVLEMPDGKRFIPLQLTYVQAPTPEEDPIYHFDLVAGEKVYFGYREAEAASACMMGEVVFITCIRSAMQE
jgi:hypothetical protein